MVVGHLSIREDILPTASLRSLLGDVGANEESSVR